MLSVAEKPGLPDFAVRMCMDQRHRIPLQVNPSYTISIPKQTNPLQSNSDSVIKRAEEDMCAALTRPEIKLD